eukprot:gb/GECG01008646.1/.p1 GENE.gb/GECG01008646.1/~~gb/GECG01008646.1/.p1  ORF type:complete len:135 (+),score=8.06 gb/GECG01008646.1/:1-405(+)
MPNRTFFISIAEEDNIALEPFISPTALLPNRLATQLVNVLFTIARGAAKSQKKTSRTPRTVIGGSLVHVLVFTILTDELSPTIQISRHLGSVYLLLSDVNTTSLYNSNNSSQCYPTEDVVEQISFRSLRENLIQ